MSRPDKELELQDERTAEKRYGEQLRKDAAAQPRPYSFTGTKVPDAPVVPVGQLVGRVALSKPDEVITGDRNDYYIGEKHAKVDGVEVYSWTAPIACSFYRQNHQHSSNNGLGKTCEDVAVIRSFRHENGRIVDFADDELSTTPPSPPFPRRKLSMPAAPATRLPLPGKSAPTVEEGAAAREPEEPEAADATSAGVDTTPSRSRALEEGRQIRAEELLRSQLSAPRGKGLSPVLSTLQADQYELVTLPAGESVVIEGQPGTGKTIVASHRAAYLVNEQTPDAHRVTGAVLVVGPTSSYSRHIRDIVQRLGSGTDKIVVLSMPELMQRILLRDDEPTGPASTVWFDADSMLGRLARLTVDLYRQANKMAPSREVAYECLRENRVADRPVTQKTDWATYLRGLPPYKQALGLRVHRPLLALIQWEIDRRINLGQIGHVIVDEAQDITALEWFLLHSINTNYSAKNDNAWTILGDLNQRRSDHTLSSWDDVFDELALDPATKVRQLARSYRSTKPILEFANKLLPAKERRSEAFQFDGPDPKLTKVNDKELGVTVLAEAARLIEAHPLGTVAVIAVRPEPIRKALRKGGWIARSLDMRLWHRSGAELSLFQPGSARGLEFDAVVVVEPADFPTNYGRQGPLYTALTRANRELAVVHSKPLPHELKRR